jgi:hypothetical protein
LIGHRGAIKQVIAVTNNGYLSNKAKSKITIKQNNNKKINQEGERGGGGRT